jgi:transcriptional regulator with GAF, ATPase, and Fis domain
LEPDRGSLFLDEIGDMPISLRPALLRFLDTWTVRPIGSNKEQKVEVQLITATNCALEDAIAEKRFGRDLLHRIDGVEIFLPPLRERSDFEQIAWDLLGRISRARASPRMRCNC